MITPVFALRAYRARNDDVALNSTSWTYAQDTAWTQDRDTPFRLRVHLAETAGGASNNVDWTMQYSVNGGAWTALGGLITLSGQFADLEVITPSQLTSPGGSFIGGVGQEVSPSTYRVSHVGADYAEVEYNILLPNTLANGDTVTFRALANGATTTSSVTPTLTVSAATVYQGTAALGGSGDVAGAGATQSFAAAAPSGSGLLAAAALTLAFSAAALLGAGVVSATGNAFEPVVPVYGEAALAGEGSVGATGDPYVPIVSVDAPDAWWRFTETAGATAADEVGTNDLTVTGANLNVTGSARTGSAVSFDGVDDKAESGSALGWSGAHSLTVETWLKASSWVTPTITPDSVFLLWIDTSGNLAFQVRDSADTTWAVASTTAPSTDAWHHVVGVWDRTAQRALLYVNGSLANQSAVQSFADIMALSEIVSVATDGSAFTAAEMDELAIYDTALSSARVTEHYTAGSASTVVSGQATLAGEGNIAASALTTAFGVIVCNGITEPVVFGVEAVAFGVESVTFDGECRYIYGQGDLAATAGEQAAGGQANLVGSGDVAATGLVEALGASALDGSGELAATGLAVGLSSGAVDGAGLLGATGLAGAVGQGALDGAGTLGGAGLAVALGASGLSGDGVIAAGGTTASFGAANLAGEGNLASNASTTFIGAAALAGEGALSGSGITESFGEFSPSGEGVITASGDGVALGAAALDGSGDLEATAFIILIGEAAVAGEGLLSGAGFTESFGELALLGEGLFAAEGDGITLGEAALGGSGVISGSGFTKSFAAADLDGAGNLYANAEAVNLGAVNFAGEGAFAADGEVIALGFSDLLGEGTIAGAGVTESLGSADLDGFGNLYASAGDVQQGEVVLLGEGLLASSGLTLSYGEVSVSGDGLVGADGKAISLGGVDFSGSGSISVTGEAEAVAASALVGEGNLLASPSTGSVQGAAALGGSGSVGGSAVVIAYGSIVCNAPSVVFGADDITFNTETVLYAGAASPIEYAGEGVTFGVEALAYGGDGCRYIYGEGIFEAGQGAETSFSSASLSGEGRLGAIPLGAARACEIKLETGDTVLLEDGYLLLSEVPSCSTGAAALNGSGEIAGLGYLVFYGQVAFGGSGLLAATASADALGGAALEGGSDLAASAITAAFASAAVTGEGVFVSDGTPKIIGAATLAGEGNLSASGIAAASASAAFVGEGNLAGDGDGTALGAASLSGEGNLYVAAEGSSAGAVAIVGEGFLSGELVQQATACTISLEDGFGVRLEDGSRLLAEPDSCATIGFVGEGNVDSAGSAVAFGEAAFAGEGRFNAYAGDTYLGMVGFSGAGYLNRCYAILAEDGDSVLLEDDGRIITECPVVVTAIAGSANLVGEGNFGADGKVTTILHYFLKRNVMLDGRLYYLIGGDRLLGENSEPISGMTLEGANWVLGKLEEI